VIVEQSGIQLIELYENIGIVLLKDSEGNIESIVNSGRILTLNDCDNHLLNYTDEQILGSNNRIVHNYKLGFWVFNFDSFTELAELNTFFGWLPVITFKNGQKKLIKSPVFLPDEFQYNEANTQTYVLELTSQVPTFQPLQDFADEPVIWILADGTWNDDGIWVDTETWNDN
jgi:hypothetical protein